MRILERFRLERKNRQHLKKEELAHHSTFLTNGLYVGMITKSDLFRALPLTAVFICAGCDAPSAITHTESPQQVYDRYHKLVKNGRNFDEDKAFYSQSRQAEVMTKASTMARANGGSIEDITNAYLQMTELMAKCSDLTLIDERINGVKAYLTYRIEDLCENDLGTEGRESIELVNEGGWKITSNVTKWTS